MTVSYFTLNYDMGIRESVLCRVTLVESSAKFSEDEDYSYCLLRSRAFMVTWRLNADKLVTNKQSINHLDHMSQNITIKNKP